MMDEQDRKIIELTVAQGVKSGLEPIWEKMRDHDTSIALAKQAQENCLAQCKADAEQGKIAQAAQGERLGVVEQDLTRFNTHKRWILGIFALVKGAIVYGLYVLFKKGG